MAGSFIHSLSSLFPGSDEQAMWRVKMEDDPQAFTRLVRRWEGAIRNLGARMTGDLHRGEDLAQEAFTRIYTRRRTYEQKGKFSTYLWRIALNVCHDELRRVSRSRELSFAMDAEEIVESPHFVDQSSGPDLRIVENERAEIVRNALLQLAEPHRAVVVLRHYEGLRFREIADVLEIPEGTVKSRMSEALSRLHSTLSRTLNEGDTPCTPKTNNPILTV